MESEPELLLRGLRLRNTDFSYINFIFYINFLLNLLINFSTNILMIGGNTFIIPWKPESRPNVFKMFSPLWGRSWYKLKQYLITDFYSQRSKLSCHILHLTFNILKILKSGQSLGIFVKSKWGGGGRILRDIRSHFYIL